RCWTLWTVEVEILASWAMARIEVVGFSVRSWAALSLPAALLMGRVRPSLPSLVFEWAFCALERRRILAMVPAERPTVVAISRLDQCGRELRIRCAAAVRSVRVKGSPWVMF